MEPLTLFGLGTNIMFSLGIVFAIVFIIFYVRQRFSDYNHKLNSMFQLISAMADEINKLKNGGTTEQKSTQLDMTENNDELNNNELMKLVVSDEESSDSEIDSDDESDEDINNIDYNNVIINNNNVKQVVLDDSLEKVVVQNISGNTLTIDDNLEKAVLEEVTNDLASNSDDVKVIELNTEGVVDNNDVNKMTVKQLRDLVTQKGIVFEKTAKKQDLIKLLQENSN